MPAAAAKPTAANYRVGRHRGRPGEHLRQSLREAEAEARLSPSHRPGSVQSPRPGTAAARRTSRPLVPKGRHPRPAPGRARRAARRRCRRPRRRCGHTNPDLPLPLGDRHQHDVHDRCRRAGDARSRWSRSLAGGRDPNHGPRNGNDPGTSPLVETDFELGVAAVIDTIRFPGRRSCCSRTICSGDSRALASSRSHWRRIPGALVVAPAAAPVATRKTPPRPYHGVSW